MPDTPMTKKHGENIVKLLIGGMICMLLVVGYVFIQGYQGRQTLVESQRSGCERGKLDRIDNAAFQKAHKTYIDKVVLAQSVKEDVKQAAREAVETYNKTAASLASRSKINCHKAFPEARLIP